MSFIIKTNVSRGTNYIIADVGIEILAAGGSETIDSSIVIERLKNSSSFKSALTDNAHGANSSTIILNDGNGNIAQADVLDFLANYGLPPVNAIGGNQISEDVLDNGDTGKALVWNGTMWEATPVAGVDTIASAIDLNPVTAGTVNLQEWIDTNWSPLLVPNLQLWLDSSHGVTLDSGKVASWQDRGPSKRTFIQPNSSSRVSFYTIGDNEDGHAVVSKTSADQWMYCPAGETSGLGIPEEGITIACVVRSTAEPRTNGQLFSSITTYPSNPRTGFNFYLATPSNPLEKIAAFYTNIAIDDDIYNPGSLGLQMNNMTDGLWHILIFSVDPQTQTTFYEQNGFGGPMRLWNTPYEYQEVAEDFGTIITGDPNIQYNLFGLNNVNIDIENVDVRHYMQFNRVLNSVEINRLREWLERDLNRISKSTYKVAEREEFLYVTEYGDDSNHGRNSIYSLKTLSEAIGRYSTSIPYIPNGAHNDFKIGDGHGVLTKYIELGPGTFRIPSLSGLHSTQIRGTIEIEEVRTITSVICNGIDGSGEPLTITVDGSSLSNDQWRGRLLQFTQSSDPTYRRITVSKNIGNTLYCSAERPGELNTEGLIAQGVELGLINHLTTLEFSVSRYQFISNCFHLQIVDAKITGVWAASDLGGNVPNVAGDRPLLSITGGSQVVIAGCSFENLGLCVRNGGILYMRRGYFAPHYGGYNQGFMQVCRYNGSLELEGVSVDGILAPLAVSPYNTTVTRFDIQNDSVLNLRGIMTWRSLAGVYLDNSFAMYNSVDGHLNWFDECVYGFVFVGGKPSQVGPILRTNKVILAQDWDWDIWASDGAKVFAVTAPTGPIYRTACGGHIWEVNDPTESGTNSDGSTIFTFYDSYDKVPYGPRKEQVLTLLNGWASAGGNYPADVTISKDAVGRISLSGAVTGGTAATAIATVDVGLRPEKEHVFVVATTSGVATISIQTNGDIYVLSTAGGTLFLDSIFWIRY